MTKNKFGVITNWCIYENVDEVKKWLNFDEVVDLLNGLSEDNEYLEKRFKEEEWHYDHIDEDRDAWKYKCQELEKETEQLKSTINTLTHDNTKMKKVLNTTKKENITLKKSETATEELLIQQWQQNTKIKHTIKEAIHNERTELGKSVLKQLLNNIEAIQ